MKPFILFVILACFHTVARGQANWQPAKATINGQKINGEVDDREWAYHIRSIDFREGKGNEIITYRPEDNVTSEVGNRRFVSTEASFITNLRDLDKLTRDTTLNRTTEKVFVRQYYAGELTLTQYIDRNEKRHFYVQMAGEDPVYLEYELRLRQGTNKKVLKTINTYRYQLSQRLTGCPTLAKEIQKTDYSLKSLSKLVDKWYQYQSLDPTFVARPDFL